MALLNGRKKKILTTRSWQYYEHVTSAPLTLLLNLRFHDFFCHKVEIGANSYHKYLGLAMVDSDKGITNLHVPSDVIIDASMPNVVRDGGQMWNKADKLEEVKCVIPDRSYATAYKTIIEDCQENGQFDWTTTGKLKTTIILR